jgi:hypothetical protein
MRFSDLFEAPLQDFGLVGDDKIPGSFRADDLRAATNKKWVDKLGIAFSKTKQKFNIYMLNAPLEGEKAVHKFKDNDEEVNMTIGLSSYRQYVGVYSIRAFNKMFGFIPPDHEQSISVLFTFNEGSGRIPFTQWMVAHRLMHAIDLGAGISEMRNVINNIHWSLYELWELTKILTPNTTDNEILSKDAGMIFGNTRALRDGNLQNSGEWFPELGAEYLVKGKITLRKPKGFEHDKSLQYLENELNKKFHHLFQRCIGNIFVV